MSDTVETKTYINNLDRDEEENKIDLATAGTSKTRGFQTSEEGPITGLQDENKYLEYLLRYLYNCIRKGSKAECVSFNQPSEFPPDSSAASCYNVSQLIWNTFIRMNTSNKKTKRKNKKLLMSVDDMHRCMSRKKETIMKLRNWIKYTESDLEGKNKFSMDQQAGVETFESGHTLLLELASIKAENQQLQDDIKALQRRTEELSDEIKDSEENEMKRLKVENQYMRSALDILRKNLIIRDEKPQMEIKPPDILMDDQELIDLTTSVTDASDKFYSLETEMDNLYRKISQLSTMVAGIDRNNDTESSKKNNVEATARKPRNMPPKMTDQSQQCLKLETDLELITSAWITMKEKERLIEKLSEANEDLSVNGKNLLLEIASIKAVNQQLQDDNKALQRRTEELSDEIKDSEESLGAMEIQIKEHQKREIQFKDAYDAEVRKTDHQKKEFEALQLQYDRLFNSSEIMQANYQERERQIIEAYDAEVRKMEYQTEQYDGLLNRLGTMQSQIVNYQERERQIIEAYNAEARKTEYQKEQYDGLLNRFSKLAGERLVHENPNITDLSDPNRPTKLAEVYSELYDNEWTDAFEELITANHTDKEAIENLLDIIMMSFHKCRELTWQRYQSLQSILSTIDIHQFARGLPETLTCSSKMTFDQEKDIKHVWRTSTNVLRDEAVKNLHSALLTTLKITIEDFPKTSHYLAICIDLCWKMGMQEKPMHLDVVAETNDGSETILDVTKFRYFTKTGKKVAYVVWPALLLHEGGPMLVKGIAQGCLETDL